MKIFTKILETLLLIIISLSIVFLILINTLNSTILNKNYVLEQLETSNYYENINEAIKSSFENYIGQSGLDENVLENIVTNEKIKNDTKIIIANIYDGTNQSIDISEIEQNLKNNIQQSLKNQKLNITQQNAINQYVEKICDQYKETMSHTNYENDINQVITKVIKYMEIAKKVLVIVIAILIVIILILNYKMILRGIAQIGIALTSTGIIYIIANIYIKSKIKIQNILILNDAVSETVKTIFTNILNTILKNGTVILGCGIVIIIISNIINNIIKNKNKQFEEGEE